jgi:small-conductance mechanosensitive channel/CRP-like cAMP-binding protein
MSPWLQLAICVGTWLLATILLSLLARRLDRRRHPLAATVRATRGLLLPPILLFVVALQVAGWPRDDSTVRVLETLVWIAAIGVVLSLVTNTALTHRDGTHYHTRFPKLFLDILRLIMVVVGAAFVIRGVWGGDLSGLLTAVGVSSIVLGLALQNTLDNLMAGIALLFERPFEPGDWIQVGNTTGQIIEMNWRSLRVRTRRRDLVVVPNSVIGKETLVNFSRPTHVHGEMHSLAFSYDDPPNKVKRILHQVALTTRGVLADPPPQVRTQGYAAYSIEYQVRFFIDDFERLLEINDEFMTKVWYAARRNGLTIPFPTQTSYEYHAEWPRRQPVRALDELTRVPVFVPLGPEDLEALSRDCVRQDYGRGERIVRQGDAGDTMFVILEGTAVVSLSDAQGSEREVARLGRGEFFGEMALLTGEHRTANVTATDDLAVLVIYKEALRGMLARRPALAHEMAEIVEARRLGLRAIQDLQSAPPEQRARVAGAASELVRRMRRFFGL